MADLSASLSKFLKTTSKKWQQEAQRAKEDKGYGTIEDGRYVMRAMESELTVSKSDKPMVVTTLKVLEGDSAGTEVKKFRTLDGEDATFYLAKELMVFGYDPEDITFDPKKEDEDGYILNVLQAISEEQPVVKVRVVTKGEYQNINIESLVEDYEEIELEDDDDDEEEEEKPAPKKSKKSEPEPKKKDKKVVEPEEDDDDDDDDDEEEEEKPTPKKSKKPEPAPAKKKSKKPEPEPEPEEEDEEEEDDDDDDEVELAVGMKITFTHKKEEMTGTVKEILEDEEKVKVKSGSKIYTIDVDKITDVDGDTDD